MKAKIKSGQSLLFTQGCSNDWNSLQSEMIINFAHKRSFIRFHQSRNHLYITTYDGTIDIVFTGEVPVLTFDSYEKDQLILKIVK